MKSKKATIQTILHIIVLIMFLAVFVSIFYNNNGRDDYVTESALMLKSTDSAVINGVFIRDENVIKYNGEGSVSYSVSDGGKVGKGSVIAEIYPSSEQIQINQQISSLEDELALLKKIQNPGTIESAQPSSLSVLIQEQYRNLIYYRDLKNYSKISEKEENLLVYLSTYQLLTNSDVSFTDRISEITAEINNLKLEMSQPVDVKTSDRSAYFVSYCDGYEDELKKSNIENLTADYLKTVEDKKLTDENIIGKTIDSYEWYIAGIVDNTNKSYEAGQRIKIKTESSPEEHDAEIIDVIDNGNPAESVIVASSDEFGYSLVQHRCERTEIIKGVYNGLKVPRKAIRFQKNSDSDEKCKGVYILQGEQVVFRKIDVIYEGNDYVLSKVFSKDEGTDYLALYDDIIVEGLVEDYDYEQ
ncbi:MAG TPA: hypothetical protein DCQ78_03520 [Ruminococcus sp.]|nr:hypothetical protein [Ruminococcus sp.]